LQKSRRDSGWPLDTIKNIHNGDSAMKITKENLDQAVNKNILTSTQADEMTKNLQPQLSMFKEKIKQNPEPVKIVHRKGYSGGGAISLYELAILFVIAAVKINLTSSSRGRKKHVV
jgi:rhombotail lipoprotein